MSGNESGGQWRPPVIERVFQLAGRGQYQSVDELVRVLGSEGYENASSHLFGKGIRLELRQMMKASRQASLRQVPER